MSVMFLCFALRIREMEEEPVNIGARKIKNVLYKKETLDIFFHLNKMHSIAKDTREKSWKEKRKRKKPYKDYIFVALGIEKLLTYYILGRTWALASNRAELKPCITQQPCDPGQVAKVSPSPQGWHGAKRCLAQS